jgi:gas vesicle protein
MTNVFDAMTNVFITGITIGAILGSTTGIIWTMCWIQPSRTTDVRILAIDKDIEKTKKMWAWHIERWTSNNHFYSTCDICQKCGTHIWNLQTLKEHIHEDRWEKWEKSP